MANIRDLMIPEDAMEMEERYAEVLREYNDENDYILTNPSGLIDWEVDYPEDFE